jgi:hypothetical protein
MRRQSRPKSPVPVYKQENHLIVSINPSTLHVLSKLAIELVKLSTKSTPASPTTPSTPSPKIEIEGTLAIAYGSVKLTSHYPHNVTWIDSLGNTIADGGLSEMFVIDGTVFGFGNDGRHYQHSGDRSSGWAAIDSIQYAVLKSTAKRIIVPATLAPTRPVSA